MDLALAAVLQADSPALPIDAVGWTVLLLSLVITVLWLVYLWR